MYIYMYTYMHTQEATFACVYVDMFVRAYVCLSVCANCQQKQVWVMFAREELFKRVDAEPVLKP